MNVQKSVKIISFLHKIFKKFASFHYTYILFGSPLGGSDLAEPLVILMDEACFFVQHQAQDLSWLQHQASLE